MKRKMNHSSTPLLRGNAPIPQLISPPYGSPSHWNHHGNPIDFSLSQLGNHTGVHTSSYIPHRIDEHRGNPLYEDLSYRFPHLLLPYLGLCSTIHSSSVHGLSHHMSSKQVSFSCMGVPCLCPCLGDSWGGVRGWKV